MRVGAETVIILAVRTYPLQNTLDNSNSMAIIELVARAERIIFFKNSFLATASFPISNDPTLPYTFVFASTLFATPLFDIIMMRKVVLLGRQ